ncbi:MAG: ABC transporter permease [Planctomycetota bacterium]|jgi:putative ABC transport system permease protein
MNSLATVIDPGWGGLAAAAALMIVLVAVAFYSGVRLFKEGLMSSARATIQLLCVGLILGWVFAREQWWAITLILIVMTLIAGFTTGRRVNKVLKAMGPMFTLVLGGVTAITLVYITQVAVGVHEFNAQYFIPLGGMILGNAMTSAVLASTRFVEDLEERRDKIEAALALGASPKQAVQGSAGKAFFAAVTPVLNAMLIVGIVKLPGVMVGTLLGGVSPFTAAKYQLVVMFMLAFGDGITALITLAIIRRRVFTQAWQLRL